MAENWKSFLIKTLKIVETVSLDENAEIYSKNKTSRQPTDQLAKFTQLKNPI